ncbi:transcription antitermination factor NusB [Desulfonema ishimotonii]|uniref:Transcription antitermination protein NusB n=1 Tax=Desulfonema ishimotonii TaxID=45657 RepID=A0A401FRW6_9BACT|nr:transcription antitermination factor NusB [Desulfonema ishimotonii]GBC59690.1 transcription antitermination factor NusB [Desulfonema ishimotonii]
MKIRRKSRELALQALFYMDVRQNVSTEAFELFCTCFSQPDKSHDFFSRLTKGVMRYRSQIDNIIERFSSNWKISRMGCVDRNIMRVAVYEVILCEDIPAKVSINEAIEIGKKFGTDESGAFINGILDSVRLTLEEDALDFDAGSADEVPLRIPSVPVSVQDEEEKAATVRFSRVRGRPGVVRRRGHVPASPPDTTDNP